MLAGLPRGGGEISRYEIAPNRGVQGLTAFQPKDDSARVPRQSLAYPRLPYELIFIDQPSRRDFIVANDVVRLLEPESPRTPDRQRMADAMATTIIKMYPPVFDTQHLCKMRATLRREATERGAKLLNMMWNAYMSDLMGAGDGIRRASTLCRRLRVLREVLRRQNPQTDKGPEPLKATYANIAQALEVKPESVKKDYRDILRDYIICGHFQPGLGVPLEWNLQDQGPDISPANPDPLDVLDPEYPIVSAALVARAEKIARENPPCEWVQEAAMRTSHARLNLPPPHDALVGVAVFIQTVHAALPAHGAPDGARCYLPDPNAPVIPMS